MADDTRDNALNDDAPVTGAVLRKTLREALKETTREIKQALQPINRRLDSLELEARKTGVFVEMLNKKVDTFAEGLAATRDDVRVHGERLDDVEEDVKRLKVRTPVP